MSKTKVINKIHIIAVALCFTSLTAWAQNITETNQADSLDIFSVYENLPEVMVVGERPIVKLEGGKLSYNMPVMLERIPADNAFDALKNIPGINVKDESVNFAGQPLTLIIDGKVNTMSYEQVMERLKMMPAEQIEKVEFMLSTPARYHVRGASLNIITKHHKGKKHFSGQVQGDYTQSKYASGGAKGNLLYSNGKLTIDANYSYTNINVYAEAEHEAQHPLNNERVAYYDHTTNRNKGDSHQYRAGFDYQFATNHALNVAYTGSCTSYKSNNNTTGNSIAKQFSDGHNYLHNVDLYYNFPFGLQITAAYTHYEAPKDQLLDGTLYEAEKNLVASSRQEINKWLVAADQLHSLQNGWGLSYGVKAQFTNNNSFQTTQTADGEVLPEATSHVDIDERIINAYFGFNKQIGKNISVDASIAAENFHTPQWNEWRVYPTVNAIWNVNEHHLLNLSFSSNAEYPSYWSTMSSIHYSSTYSEILGNPNLKPTSSYNLSLMWQLNRRYTFVAFADFKPNFSAQLPYQPSDRFAVIMKEVNFNHRNTYGIQASALFSAGQWLNGNVFVVGQYTQDKCDDFFDLPFNRNKFNVIAGGMASFLLSKHANIRFILNPFFQSNAIQGVYDIKNLFKLNATLRWASADDKWNVVLSENNLTNSKFKLHSSYGNQDFSMNVGQDWTTANLSVIFKFGNYKRKNIKQVDTSRMGY
ncbi:outer membrane beta-barrel protein [Bacteroides eggerthii]|jgi:hypothetical protein|uniref:outer membrane beta-barrel protein n=1 Tax=Bacteroides eggerthii TaxID=28111 RepID=UPI00321B6205